MKKVLISSVLAIALVGAGSTAFAATTKPSVKSSKGAAEGTAKHEMSESSSTQKTEGAGTPAKKIPSKKASTKATTKKK